MGCIALDSAVAGGAGQRAAVRRVAARQVDDGAAGCGQMDGSTVVGVAADGVAADGEAADGSAPDDSARNRRMRREGPHGVNSATVAGAGADGCPEHRCSGDAVAGGVGKGEPTGKAA